MDADKVTPVWTGRAILGEGPLWSERLGLVLFVDIKGSRLLAWAPADGTAREWPMAEPCCWLVERRDGQGFIAGMKRRIVDLALDPDSGPTILREVAQPEADRPWNRFNDGKGDQAGRVWFGSMDDDEALSTGSLYRMTPDGAVVAVDAGYGVANGPAVSPDGGTLYHADSAARVVYAFRIGEDGNLTDKREHLRFTEADGYPDGMTTDAEGGLWVAHWDGGRVTRFLPDGTRDRHIALPASRVTSVTFFGTGFDRMAITTASIGRDDEPLAGSLFVADPGVRGLPPGRFG